MTDENYDAYKDALRVAMVDGKISEEEQDIMDTLRKSLEISEDAHKLLLKEVRGEVGGGDGEDIDEDAKDYANDNGATRFDKLIEQGREAYYRNEFDSALNLFNEAQQEQPDNNKALYYYKKMEYHMQQSERGEDEEARQEEGERGEAGVDGTEGEDGYGDVNRDRDRDRDREQDKGKSKGDTGKEEGVCPSCNGTHKCHWCQGSGQCYWCNGAGVCDKCGGTGVYRGKECWACKGSGKCHSCKGNGICYWCKGTGVCSKCS